MQKILIIDDDPDIVEGMKVVLESRDYQVVSVNNGDEGIRKAKEERPGLVILDVMMETKDKGFEVARAIKKDNKDLPIIMLTAIKEKLGFDFKAEAGDEDWLPVNDYLDKPLKPQELLLKVENLLKK